MKIDNLLHFIFGIKKSTFEITQQEIDILNNKQTVHNKNKVNSSPIVDLELEYIDEIELLFEGILEEVYLKSKGEIMQLWSLKFPKLDTYIELKKESVFTKKELLYWLTGTISETYTKTNSYCLDDHGRFILECKKTLISLLIKTNLGLTEKDYIHFIKFWKNHDSYFYPVGVFMSKFKKKVKKEGVSSDMKTFLRSILACEKLQTGYYQRTREIIEEILRIP